MAEEREHPASPLREPGVVARTRAFFEWEIRGRGWVSYPYQVELEPPFRSFSHAETGSLPQIDDGKRPTWLSSMLSSFGTQKRHVEVLTEEESEPPPEPAVPHERTERVVTLGSDVRVSPEATRAWLQSLAAVTAPVSFEVIGQGGEVEIRISSATQDAPIVFGQLHAFFPDAVVTEPETTLEDEWRNRSSHSVGVLEFGLARECVLPLAHSSSFSPDPLTSIVGALANVQENSIGVFQVLFHPVRQPWAREMLKAVVTPSGQPFFADAPEVTTLAQRKVVSGHQKPP